VDLSEVQANLRHLIWEWDPIGIADFAPEDEYDCLVGPLLSKLSRGGGREEISNYLRSRLVGHFGLDPDPQDVDQMANRLVVWWAAVPTERGK
jgi:hypothetical protein